MNHRLRALMLFLLLAPATVLAQQTAERSATYEVDTGDSWVDAQLQDINHYAERYPDAFLDEVSRYADVPRGYISALFTTHGWQAGDIYFACFWAKASGQTCRDSVRAFSQDPEGGWEAVVKRMPTKPDNLHYRAVRHAIVASYQHWDRPITLDATLKRQFTGLGGPRPANCILTRLRGLPPRGRHYPVMLLCVSPPPRAPATIRVRAVPRSRNRVTDERLFRFA